MLHVAFGPGKLTLGLLIPITRQAGFDACLIGRPDSKHPANMTYLLDIVGRTRGQEKRRVAYAGNPETLADLPAELRERLASDEDLLVTCSVGGNITSALPLLEAIAALRSDLAESVLVICENTPGDSYQELPTRLGHNFTICSSVVDRVCSSPEPQRTERGWLIVNAHPIAEWTIEHPDPAASRIIARLVEAGPEIVTPVAHLPPYEDRKIWTVNGLHLALALAARLLELEPELEERRELNLADIARTDGFTQAAAAQIESLTATLAERAPELPPLRPYAAERVQVFCEVDDTVARILEKVFVREDLTGFLRRLSQRIADPARAAHALGVEVAPFRAVIIAALRLLEDPDSFYEDEKGRELDPELDRQIVDEFRTLLDGWTTESQQDRYVARFERALRATYDG